MALEPCNEHNVANTIALVIAQRLLDDGYLLYWHTADAVQTPTGWLPNYSAQQAEYLADPTYAAQVAAAKGLFTILSKKSAISRWITRPTNSGEVQPQDAVPIPALAIHVGALVTGPNYQLGDRATKWRSRSLMIEAFARTDDEQAYLTDALTAWLAEDAPQDIHDHENAVPGEPLQVVNTVEVESVSVDSFTDRDEAEATTYEVLYSARLSFVS